ncbi:MAG: phosphodiesterase, partial [Microbacteriaceae bacterium]|nr:phosphodiesterase [Microbacteriaceae bacterium]
VSVAAATCYTLDLSAGDRILSGVDFGQAFNMVHVYEDRLVHSIIPVGQPPEVSGFSGENWPTIEAMTPEQRIAMFSDKASPFNSAEAASSD